MGKKPGANSKGRPAGSGCVSAKRRELFRTRALNRELKTMEVEDINSKNVDWRKDKAQGNKKPRLLSAEEVAKFFEQKDKKGEGHQKEMEEENSQQKKEKEIEEEKGQEKKEKEMEEDKGQEVGQEKKKVVEEEKTVVKEEKREVKKEPAGTIDKMEPAKAAEAEKTFGPSKVQSEKEKQDSNQKQREEMADLPDWGTSSSEEESSSSSSSSRANPSLDKKDGAAQPSLDKKDGQGAPQPSLDKKDGQGTNPSLDKKDWKSKRSDLGTFIEETVRNGSQASRQTIWRLKPNKKVAVDWYQTTRLKGGVPWENIKALQKLQFCGWEVTLVSYCGKRRELEVREEIYAMRHDFIFDRLCFTRSKCGMTGKCAKAQELGINYVIDDDSEIFWECFGRGKWVYPVRTQYQQHDWSRWKFSGLPQAVDQLIKDVN